MQETRVASVHTSRVFRAGCQRLDGAASVDRLRQRRGLPDGAFDRDRTAQAFAAGLVRRAGGQGVLSDPARLSGLVAAVGPKVAVAGGATSLLELLRVVPELKSLDPVGINLPVDAPADRSWVVGTDPAATPQFLAALRQDRLAQWVAEHPGRVTPMG
ncbi:hypothetical protein E1193_23185 [Micromonospora sp. KC606]|uniref:hypothetical protein n=1 Tax=Micromonospora sp. KC606 TaxID=2530379 RepID=UPI00104CCFB0|nr:hypothetical protein [Micromonospora sp. KC606]TDC76924.1 hypothetical protein E1193_23185 [Micromonospora sp. KC606]